MCLPVVGLHMNDDGMWQRLPKRICLEMIVTDMYQRLPKSICAKPLPNYWFCDSIFLFTGCEPLPHHPFVRCQRLPKSICAKLLPNYWFCGSILLFTGCEPLPHHPFLRGQVTHVVPRTGCMCLRQILANVLFNAR